MGLCAGHEPAFKATGEVAETQHCPSVGPGSLGQLEIWLRISLAGRKQWWKIIIPLKIVIHGNLPWLVWPLTQLFHFTLDVGSSPRQGQVRPQSAVTIYPAHLWDSSKWNCQRRTTVLSKAFPQVHGIFKIITRKKGLEFWRICQKSSAQWEDENGFILPETPTSTQSYPKNLDNAKYTKTTEMLSFLDRHPWKLRITITSNMSYWSSPPRLVNNKSCSL